MCSTLDKNGAYVAADQIIIRSAAVMTNPVKSGPEPPFLLLMPSYNQAHYIGEAVQSVLAQDDPNWQLWIVDNSGDSTPEARRFSNSAIWSSSLVVAGAGRSASSRAKRR